MGAKVEIENYMPGHYSMRDITLESNGAIWPPCYGDNNLANGQFYSGFFPRPHVDLVPEYDKDVMKQTMLEHEAIFKNQVYELHRVYQVQRDLMDEVRRKERFSRQLPYEASSSSSPVLSQMQTEDVRRWNSSSLPLANSRPSILGPDTISKGKNIQGGPSPSQNCHSPRNSQSRPTKCRRRMLDLQLPANEYVDITDGEEVSDNIIFSPDKNGNLRSDLGKSKILADLNEPIYVEEATGVSSVDFLGRAESQRAVQCGDLSTRPMSSSKDVRQNYPHVSLNGTASNLPFDNRPHNQNWFSYALESEKHKGVFRAMNQGIQEQKPTIPSELDQICQRHGFLTGDHIKGIPRKAKYGCMLEKSDRSYHPPSSYNPSEQIRSFHLSNHQPGFFYHSDLGTSLDKCASSWGKPSGSFDQTSIQVQATPFDKRWNLNNSPVANEPFWGEQSLRNRFDYTNCNYKSDRKKSMRDVNLNVALPNGDDIDLPVFPCLKGKGTCQSEVKSSNALESAQSRGLPFPSSSCNGEVIAKNKLESRKILGVPMFASPSIVKKEDCVIVRRIDFDMNLPCEPEPADSEPLVEEIVIVEKKSQTKFGIPVNQFDLNSCITEEEEEEETTIVKGGTGIDLEAPVIIESDEDVKESEKHPEEEELARSAAEAIIALSVNPNTVNERGDADVEDTLCWFAGIACSSENDLENKGSPRMLDDFECMTLSLREMTFEECFPKPSFPEIPNLEETSGRCLIGTRSRRGRQKRDFQRDVLPGLTSLARHEVTEDLQTFGGLMRATGHPWHSGPNRRNGRFARGRRRSVVATAHVPVSTESPSPLTREHIGNADRSLTGWGKTTRRPRRQRYAPGNPPIPVPLS